MLGVRLDAKAMWRDKTLWRLGWGTPQHLGDASKTMTTTNLFVQAVWDMLETKPNKEPRTKRIVVLVIGTIIKEIGILGHCSCTWIAILHVLLSKDKTCSIPCSGPHRKLGIERFIGEE